MKKAGANGGVGKQGAPCSKNERKGTTDRRGGKPRRGVKSGGTCKATMKAHNLNGPSCFSLIAVRMSRRFPRVIAVSVAAFHDDATLLSIPSRRMLLAFAKYHATLSFFSLYLSLVLGGEGNGEEGTHRRMTRMESIRGRLSSR